MQTYTYTNIYIHAFTLSSCSQSAQISLELIAGLFVMTIGVALIACSKGCAERRKHKAMLAKKAAEEKAAEEARQAEKEAAAAAAKNGAKDGEGKQKLKLKLKGPLGARGRKKLVDQVCVCALFDCVCALFDRVCVLIDYVCVLFA